MHSDVNEIFDLVELNCIVSDRYGLRYITTQNISETLTKLLNKGFVSLTDCFTLKNKTIYIQLTNFEMRQSLFVITQYENISILRRFFKNFKAYEIDILRYLQEC